MRLYRVTAEVTFPSPSGGTRTYALATTRIGPGTRNDGRALPRTGLHADRAHGCAPAHGRHCCRSSTARSRSPAQSWDRGEAKAEQVSDMRATLAYLRAQLSEQYPQRMWKTPELSLMFAGEREELRYAAVLPERVAGGGVYYFRLAVVRTGEKSQLVQERTIPDISSRAAARVRRCRALGARRRHRGVADRLFRSRRQCRRRRRPDMARSMGRPAATAAPGAPRREARQGRAVADARRRAEAIAGGGLVRSGTRASGRCARGGAMRFALVPEARAARHRLDHGAVAHRAASPSSAAASPTACAARRLPRATRCRSRRRARRPTEPSSAPPSSFRDRALRPRRGSRTASRTRGTTATSR